ncbi:MAG: choice-of-anchor D domain-containing protein [Candidatus Acidiferrales bacterium]
MRIDGAPKKTKSFTVRGFGRNLAFAGRLATVGIALSAWVFAAGCTGLTSNPTANSTGAGAGATGGSQSSQLSPSSAQVSFGNVAVGSSTSQLVTLTAAGSADVKISSVTASGAGYSVSGGSNVTLTPSESVTLSVAFQPTATGSATGDIIVASNASNSNLQISLSGDGAAASGNHSVALNWQPSSSPVTGYFVFRGSSASDLSQITTSAVPTTTYTDTKVVNGQTYVYAVKSVNASNMLSGYSNAVTVQIPAQ